MAKILTDNWHLCTPTQTLLVNEPVRFVLFHIIYKTSETSILSVYNNSFPWVSVPVNYLNFRETGPRVTKTAQLNFDRFCTRLDGAYSNSYSRFRSEEERGFSCFPRQSSLK